MAESGWMPVFVVLEAAREPQASKQGETLPARSKRASTDFWQRVGTAFVRKDGGYNLQLFAIPTNARLVMRPPQPGEHADPTHAE